MIYGEDALLPQVKSRLAWQPELAQRVGLIGKVAHKALRAWYSAADLFLTSSPAEGSNYALIESMSCGALPVCSDIPPHRFIVGNHAVGWLVGNAESCANALVAAQGRRNQQTRSDVRRWFDAHLSWPAIAQQMQSAYQSLSSLPHYA
jgi:glycosyltransferase involved in cell wall biosynthesis